MARTPLELPGEELDALLALIELDPSDAALGRPRSVRGALLGALRLVGEHLLFSLLLSLGAAGAGELVIDLLALALALAGVEQAFGWALSLYLAFVSVGLALAGVGKFLERHVDAEQRARKLLARATAERPKRADFDAWSEACTRLREVRQRRRAAARLRRLLERLPRPAKLEFSAGKRWCVQGFVGPSGALDIRFAGERVEVRERATNRFMLLGAEPGGEDEAREHERLVDFVGPPPEQTPPRSDLRAIQQAFWAVLGAWLLIWLGLSSWAAAWLWTQLPAPVAAFAGYPVAGSLGVLLLGLATRLPARHPGWGRALLSLEERAAPIYDDLDHRERVRAARALAERDRRRRA